MKEIDPKYLNIPNINFSLTDKEDDREDKFKKQRIARGFDDSETWALDYVIASFIIPRLKRFIEVNSINFNNEYEKDFGKSLPKMLKAFELVVRDEGSRIWTDKEEKQYNKGIKLFQEYFLALWC